MKTSKINGRNCRQLASEIAKIVGKSVHFNEYGYVLTFDEADAAELELTTAHAVHYWHSVRQMAKSKAAETLRSKIKEEIISQQYARTFAK